MKIAVISDTHGLWRPEVLPHLAGAEVILHAGDVDDPAILEQLRAVAPLHAVRGNVDYGPGLRALPGRETLDIGGHRIHLLHDLATLACDPAAEGIELVVFGHSHRPTAYERDGVHYLNPGSIGPRRFKLPISLARVEWTAAGYRHTFIEL